MTGIAQQHGTVGDLVRRSAICFFDCDGVLLNSNQIKIDALSRTLSDLPDGIRRSCLDAFKSGFGLGRRDHFVRFFRIVGDEHIAMEEFVEYRSKLYANQLADAYSFASLAPGAHEMASLLKLTRKDALVVTAGLASEAIRALSNCAIEDSFQAITGTPDRKADVMREWLARVHVKSQEAVMFGDALADADAALEAGIPFVFVHGLSLVGQSTVRQRFVDCGASFFTISDITPNRSLVDGIYESTEKC